MGNEQSKEIKRQKNEALVNLAGKDLTEIPRDIKRCKLATQLDCSNNKINDVPVELGISQLEFWFHHNISSQLYSTAIKPRHMISTTISCHVYPNIIFGVAVPCSQTDGTP